MRRAWLAVPTLFVAGACGSRTGLLVPEEGPPLDGGVDAPVERDAGAQVDTGVDAPVDAAIDAGLDALADATFDAPFDATPDADVDAGADAAPDAPADAPADVPVPLGCDGGATLIYLITTQNQLLSFDPSTFHVATIGTIACPAAAGEVPNSMAIDRTGIGYTSFTDGELFRLDMATAACESTSFVTGQEGFVEFGMGYVSDSNDPGETLYVAGDNFAGGPSQGLATIDTTTFLLNEVGPFSESFPYAELTGTADGRLFGFYPDTNGSHILSIDKATATILNDTLIQAGVGANDWAFAYWGGDFWLFTGVAGTSSTDVTQYDPATGSVAVVATIPLSVVGAGVSTCAPE